MIAANDLTVTFMRGTPGEVRALDGLSLAIAQGEFVVVIGSNGSGKSTLLNAIAGTLRLESGSITIDDRDVTQVAENRRADVIGRVFQNPFSGTAPTMTLAENLRLANLRGQPKRLQRGLTASWRTGIAARLAGLGMGLENRLDTPVGLLSGGQRQALTLLMATLREPRILLLDEHTAALDPASGARVMELTDNIIRTQRLTAMMVTHDLEQAATHGNRLVMMHTGMIVWDVKGEAKSGLKARDLLDRFTALPIPHPSVGPIMPKQ